MIENRKVHLPPLIHHQPKGQESDMQRSSNDSAYKKSGSTKPMYLEKPGQKLNRYKCHECTKSFSRPSSLRIHILSHTGEKPHVCPQPGCGRRFSVQMTISNANFPRDEEGRVYHMGIKIGDITNRILTVGDPVRARKIAMFLDSEGGVFERESQRGFLTITGRYKGVPVSIVSIGMGTSMMDFFVREARACITGTMAIVRFGSCGSLSQLGPPGSIIVPRGGFFIRRNYDYFADQPNYPDLNDQPYFYSGVFHADPTMTRLLAAAVVQATDPIKDVGPVITGGLNAEGCSFYSSQGRLDPAFWDDNTDILDNALLHHPSTQSIEMEASTLFHLAHCSKKDQIRTACCLQVFADRVQNGFIKPETVKLLEPAVGKACLEALIQVDIEDEMPAAGTVWELCKLKKE